MVTDFRIAIVGAGPAGTSAAVHAAQMGMSHILLERKSRLFGQVDEYPKAKPVMAAPEDRPIFTDMPFTSDSREAVIERWTRVVRQSGVNVRFDAEVTSVTGRQGEFRITLASGETMTSEYAVISVGVHGNLRRLMIPGSEANPRIQYRVEDPSQIKGEGIIVIGAGDSAIEDALALCSNNEVIIVQRRSGFPRAHPANVRRVQEAIRTGAIRTYANLEPAMIAGRELHLREKA